MGGNCLSPWHLLGDFDVNGLEYSQIQFQKLSSFEVWRRSKVSCWKRWVSLPCSSHVHRNVWLGSLVEHCNIVCCLFGHVLPIAIDLIFLQNHRKSFTVLQNHREPSTVLQNYREHCVAEPSTVLQNHREPSTVLQNHREPFTVLQNHREPSTVLQNHCEILQPWKDMIELDHPKPCRLLELL